MNGPEKDRLEENFLEVYDKFKFSFYRKVFSQVHEREGSLTAMEVFSLEVDVYKRQPLAQVAVVVVEVKAYPGTVHPKQADSRVVAVEHGLAVPAVDAENTHEQYFYGHTV